VGADGPRIVVFRIAGNIALKSSLNIRTPYLTVAGQSAPGDGACLTNYPLVLANTHDVIVRFLRFRPGDQNDKNVDSLGGRNVKNVVIDHCSASWSFDTGGECTRHTPP
jgi:Pectate lyase